MVSPITPQPSKEGFSPLFPASFTSAQSEISLCLWDFLDYARGLLGDPSCTISDISCIFDQSVNYVPTFGQVVFDELCTLFTGVLLSELQTECLSTVREFRYQEILMAKPLNIITWPFIARGLLIVLRQAFQPAEMIAVFNAPATEREVS